VRVLIRGLYTAASGMLHQMTKTDVISSNLANVNTTAYKRDTAIFESLKMMRIHRIDDPYPAAPDQSIDPRPFIGLMGTGVRLDEIYTDFSQGPIETTSNPLDLALHGDGFFEVITPTGPRYTRDGSFSLSSEGYLVTKEGYRVMGENGPVLLPRNANITINEGGEIFSDGQRLDRLRIVSFEDNHQLIKVGENLYMCDESPQPAEVRVIQGALEGANSNSITEMVNLINAFRAYEASQKIVTIHDNSLDRAVNDIARK